MKTPICYFLMLSMLFLSVLSCKTDKNKASSQATESLPSTLPAKIDPPSTKEKENTNTASTSINTDEVKEEITASISPGSLGSICGNESLDLVKKINSSAKALKGTPYSQANKTDCSGMFHKMLNTFRDDCPSANLPTIDNARSSRDIAKWYHDQGTLQIIRDPSKSNQLIKPGMVMFYGYGDRLGKYDFKTLDIETLMTRSVGINHVAIVTSVEVKDGVVESYDIFHGLRPGKPADVTTSSRVYTNRPELPMYGNWKEPWLAVANVLVSKS